MKHIIYIPGFGEHFDFLRRLALRRWRRADTKVTFVPMRWNNRHETYEQKYDRIHKVISQLKADEIVLAGESAGGAMSMLAFSRLPKQVSKVVTICGYNHGASDVHQIHKKTHPAFYSMMPVVDDAVGRLGKEARRRITTIYSTRDHIVRPEHSHIDGVEEIILHKPGHSMNIARVLLSRTIR